MILRSAPFVFFYSLIGAAKLPNPPVFTSVPHYPPECYYPPDSGLCSDPEMQSLQDTSDEETGKFDELLTQFYFDPVTETCYPFGVQHCGGNENRFRSLDECQLFCRKSVPQPPVLNDSIPVPTFVA